jgi:hypothetical protein
MPILLVNSDGVPAATEAAIDSLGIEQAIVLGGTAAVSDDTAADLATLTGNDVVRLAGENRFGTAAAVGDFEIETLGFDGPDYILTSGVNFPDALAAGPLGGQLGAPIVLTATLPDESATFLDEHSDILENQKVVGGTAAVDEETAAAGEAAAEQTANDTPTGGDITTAALEGPELQSVALSGIDLDDLAAVYTYTFDEDVDDTVDPADFKLYNADTRNPTDGTVYDGGDSVDVDGEAVAVTFNLADYGVADATLAAVVQGAVVDEDGNENPAQSVATTGIGNAAGLGLVSAEITDEEDGVVEYTFGSPQLPGVVAASEYQLVTREGDTLVANTLTTLTGSSADAEVATSPDDDEPSTVVEVTFAVDLSDESIRRAVVIGNPALGTTVNERIQAVDVSGGGNTDAPDLVSVEVASDNEDLEDNQALFVFDEVVDTVGDSAGSFDLVYSHCDPALIDSDSNPATDNSLNDLITAFGGETQSGVGFDDTEVEIGGACVIPGTAIAGGAGSTLDDDEDAVDDFGTRAVLVTFGTDLIDNQFLVAAQVDDDAGVTDADGNANANDEVQYGTAPDLFEDGFTAGPQLIGVTSATDTNVFGDFTSYQITFTFDKDIDEDVALVDGFSFFTNNGEDVEDEAFDIADCEVDGDTMVVCTIDDEESEIVNAVVVSVDAVTVTGADAYDIDSDETAAVFTNPEASAPIDAPEAP